uniref:Biogenesis of lysosome-related organelles complex 1 subunit 5 n=1 Tax=Mola mola TaxID=94237 RepID=A0A3Q3W3X6_MOLML
MSKVAKDVGDIRSRLLDHKPVINAEIRYFVKEFEEKRGHRESRLLESVNKMVVETNEQMQLTDFETMIKQLSEVKKRCKSSHLRFRLCEPSFSTKLQENMDHLKDERAEFLKEQQKLKEEVDEEHKKAVEQLHTKYFKMQEELPKSLPF